MSTSLQTLDLDSTNLLSRLPESLISAAASCRVDGLRQTIEGAAAWRDALLKGLMTSEANAWPAGPIGTAIRDSFPQGLLRFTKGNKDVADAVVENLLQIADGLRCDWENRIADELEAWLNAEQERRELAAKAEEEAAKTEDETAEQKKVTPVPVSVQESQDQAAEIRAGLEQELGAWASARMERAWGEQLSGWSSVSEVFGQLQSEASFGWDLSRGLLKHVGWAKVEQMNKLLKSLPQIAEIAKALGRAKSSVKEL